MIYKRNIYNLEHFKSDIDSVIECANLSVDGYDLKEGHYFKKESYKHPTAVGAKVHDGSFEAIPNRFIRKTFPLLSKFKELERALEIEDLILTRYITRFQPLDFLEWRRLDKVVIGKIFAITTTTAHISFKDETILLPPYRAISFNSMDTHSIRDVKNMENWIVFMIPEIREPLKDYEIHF